MGIRFSTGTRELAPAGVRRMNELTTTRSGSGHGRARKATTNRRPGGSGVQGQRGDQGAPRRTAASRTAESNALCPASRPGAAAPANHRPGATRYRAAGRAHNEAKCRCSRTQEESPRARIKAEAEQNAEEEGALRPSRMDHTREEPSERLGAHVAGASARRQSAGGVAKQRGVVFFVVFPGSLRARG